MTDELDTEPRVATATRGVGPGTRVGEYLVQRKIASGGFGAVYEILHEALGRRAALKVLHSELAASREAIARFEREARAVNVIRHPNVVDIYDFGELPDGCPFFIMEYVEGITLENRIREYSRLAPGEVVSVFEPLCDGLRAAHTNGIVHRDVKASNIILEDRGDGSRVVLVDFGVAKLLEPEPGSDLTTARRVIGTPTCMSPEQIRGEAVDVRTDVYALGALLFHALTGAPPFAGENAVMMQHMHLYSRAPLVSAAAPIGTAFDLVVARAMAKEPSGRFQTVDELRSALLRAVAATPTSIRTLRASPAMVPVGYLTIGMVVDAALFDGSNHGLIDDFGRVIPAAMELLTDRGFHVAVDSPGTLTVVKITPSDGAVELRELVRAAHALRATLDARPVRDDRIHVNLHLDRGRALIAGGRVIKCEPARVGEWTMDERIDGITGSESLFRALGVDADETPMPGVLRLRE